MRIEGRYFPKGSRDCCLNTTKRQFLCDLRGDLGRYRTVDQDGSNSPSDQARPTESRWFLPKAVAHYLSSWLRADLSLRRLPVIAVLH